MPLCIICAKLVLHCPESFGIYHAFKTKTNSGLSVQNLFHIKKLVVVECIFYEEDINSMLKSLQ